jgi:hypothetical protein
MGECLWLRVYGAFARAAVFCFVCPATACSLIHATADGVRYNAVDVYNSGTGAWATAQLSVARGLSAAASVGNLVLFAGGRTSGALFVGEMVRPI